MFKRFDSLRSKKGLDRRVTRGGRSIQHRESHEEMLRRRIDEIIKNFEKTGMCDRQEITRIFDEFIQDVESILKELERAKRNVEKEEYRALQELIQLVSEERSVLISRKLRDIEESIFYDLMGKERHVIKDERRLRRNRMPRGSMWNKTKTDRGLLKNIRRGARYVKRHEVESGLRRAISMLRAYRRRPDFINRLEPRIIEILEQYHRNFKKDFGIEVDLEIEEARKLIQIGKYIRFAKILKLEEYAHRLEALRTRADYFASQDTRDSKQLRKVMARLFGISKNLALADNAKVNVFEGISEEQYRVGGIAGTLFFDMRKYDKKGVVLLTGIFNTRKQYELLSKRLAYNGYMVLSIDLPSQGDSHGKWRLGLMSEFIFQCVRSLRGKGVKSVSVMGHSAGAVASMFSALSYSRAVEDGIYRIFTRYLELSKELSEIPLTIENSRRISEIETKMAQEYTNLKQHILSSVKSGRFNQGRIDSFVLLAPPPRFQEVFPAPVAKLLGKAKQKYVKKFIDVFINTPLKKNVLRSKNPVEYAGPNKAIEDVEFFFLRVPELKDFMEYIGNLNNPCDYINLLTYFQEKSDFIRAFLSRVVRKTPKLFIYGKWDGLLKGFTPRLLFSQGFTISKRRQTEIASIYKLMGNQKIIVMPNTSHFLNEGDLQSINLRNQVIQDSRIVRDILIFLDSTLGHSKFGMQALSGNVTEMPGQYQKAA